MVFEFSFIFFFSYIFCFFIFSKTYVSMSKSYIDLCLICHYYFPVFSKACVALLGAHVMKAYYQQETGVINITYFLMIQSLKTPPKLTADKINNFIFFRSNAIVEKSLSYLYNFLFKKNLLKT